jgi:Ca-activated chloride channel family protein
MDIRDMIHFEWLWVFLFLPVPIAVHRIWTPTQVSFAALKAPFYDVISQKPKTVSAKRRITLLLATLAWLLLLIASARPQWVGDPITTPLSGRDLMLAVDLSDSMKERDMFINQHRVNRLQAVQNIAGQFIERREGDRIGLILFGSEAYLQSPLTLDRRSVKTLLDEAVIGIAGIQTAIGNAIALAVKRFSDREQSNKVLILLTDGKNTAGNISPAQATRMAKSTNLKVYTIAIGSEGLSGFNSFLRGAAVDERTLEQIAEITAGRYFRARNTEELEQIYALIDELEETDEDAQTLRPVKELFHWPGALALLLVLILVVSRLHRRI